MRRAIQYHAALTTRGSDVVRERHTIVSLNGVETSTVIQKEIMRPQMIEDFFEYFSCIDIHDHLRQGSLKMEESWKTKTWWHRIFATVLGIIFTDCYYASSYINRTNHIPTVPFMEFIEKLCYQLIFNTYLTRSVRSSAPRTNDDDIEVTDHVAHQLAPLIGLPIYRNIVGHDYKRAKRRCKVCHTKCSYYCVQCSNTTEGDDFKLVCLCPITLKTCFTSYQHK